MAGVGTGAAITGAAMIAYVAIVAASLLRPRAGTEADLPVVAWGGGGAVAAERAWVGPLAVLVLIAAMYVFTALAFNLMRALPIAALGLAGGH
jgi:cytochrome c oxidase subunit 1